jgi:DNA adenine methylase
MSYFGGKSGAGVFQTLINLMPPHETYIEPFLGGAALMRLKRPAQTNIGLDLSQSAINEAAVALRIASGSAIADGGRRRASPSPLAENVGACPGNHAWYDGEGLHYQIWRGDGMEYLEAASLDRTSLVYCDPPYLLATRRDARSRYEFEMTDLDHRRLLRVLRSLKCHVMISGYSSALYAKELKGWNATSFQAATRGAPAAEWVWYNFERPTRLHDYRFLGSDFRERERIRRRQKRWCAKLATMPLLEKQALLAVLADTE